MKKLLFLLLFSPALYGEDFLINDLSNGLYSNQSPNTIPDNSCQAIQNFTTDVEKLAVERQGYVKRDSTQLGGVKSVSGLWEFQDVDGNQWIISFSSRTFYKNTAGGTPTAFGPNITSDNIPDCAVNLGVIECTNQTDPVWWFNGTSTSTVSTAPKGASIEAWRNRFVIGNVSATQSTLYFSADGTTTTWTIGGNPTDAFTVQLGGANDGYQVTCLWGSYLDNLIAGRKRDLWAMSGFDQADVVLRNVSSEIGCLQDGTMREFDGSLVFLSGRGIEDMRGISIQNASEPIRNITDELVKNSGQDRSITQTTQIDFGAGTTDTAIYTDTETVAGNIQTTFPDLFSAFRNGTGGTKNVWTEYISGGTPPTCSFTSNGSELSISHSGNVIGECSVHTSTQVTDFKIGTTYYVNVSSLPLSTSGSPSALHFFSRPNTVSAPIITAGSIFDLVYNSSTNGRGYISSFTGGSVSSTTAYDFAIPSAIEVYMSTTTFTLTVNGSRAVNGTHSATTEKAYVYLSHKRFETDTASLRLDSFSITPQTFTYTSQLMNSGTLMTAWKPFISNQTTGGGTIQYYLGSTNTASIPAVVNYQLITNGSVPTIATGSYAVVKSSVITDTWDDQPVINDFTIAWSEGQSQPMKSWVYDRRYWLAFTTSTVGGAFNDRVLVYQRNRTWSLFKGINAASFAIWRDHLYFGNSDSTGYVYKFDEGNNDDGSDIESVIITKSYDLGTSPKEKSFKNVYVNYNGALNKSGTFVLDYKLNQVDSTQVNLSTFSMTENLPGSIRKAGFPRSQSVQGREISYTLRKNGTGDRLKLYGLWTVYNPKEIR